MPRQDLVPISVNTGHSPSRAPAYLLQRDGAEAFSANLTGKVMPVVLFFYEPFPFGFNHITVSASSLPSVCQQNSFLF